MPRHGDDSRRWDTRAGKVILAEGCYRYTAFSHPNDRVDTGVTPEVIQVGSWASSPRLTPEPALKAAPADWIYAERYTRLSLHV
jgi:hypothetical protein